MTTVIVSILIIGLLLIATARINKMNTAAVAMFMGASCWVLYTIDGSHYVNEFHLSAFVQSGLDVKSFIAEHIFFKYVVSAAEVVLYLLATMTIVEILSNNGCFDFINEGLKTRKPRKFLWMLALFTFILSANLDNLTTTCLMLSIMHSLVANDKLRRVYGFIIVICANMGGAFTVIGDISSLTLWNSGAVTATQYSAYLALPSLVALVTTLLLFYEKLPHRLELVNTIPPYRGDDTILNRWQRFLMLIVGIGGLWFIPTFHSITALPPFVGALCVLALLWIVNELCNRQLIYSDQMIHRRFPLALQYANIQNMMFFIGIIFAIGAVNETGMLKQFSNLLVGNLQNPYIIGASVGLLAAFINNMTSLVSNIYIFSDVTLLTSDQAFWPLISFCSTMGGSLLAMGTIAGIYFVRMENATVAWYLKHCSWRVLVGWLAGLVTFAVMHWLM